MRKKSRILKSFLATASILGLSLTIPVNEIYAVAVSQMVGDVNLNNPNTNFNPPFVDGNTIEVINSGNMTVSNSGTYNIGAIRADQEVTAISVGSGSTDLAINLTIGSMSGVVKGLNITRFNNATNINITLNGNAGVGNIPPVNDYSALQQVSFTQMGGGDSTNSINLNINAPITLNSTFNTSASSETINVNDDVIITQPTKASGAENMNFNIAGDKSLTLSAPNSIQDGTGAGRVRFNFTGANSVLNIDGTNTTIRGAITNGANGTLNVNAGVTTATDSTVTTIQKTNIADNTTFNIDSVNSNMNLLNNGTSIAFKGASSELDLINTGNTDKQFTLYSNLNPSDAEDEYGIVRVEATTNNLTIANNGGPYTIGKDNTHLLKEFEVKGAGNVVVDNQVFTKRFNMNSTGQVTLNQRLDLGAGGNIAFGADGTLVVNNGITGDINFKGNDGVFNLGNGSTIDGAVTSTDSVAGSLYFIGDGEVTGDIGTDDENKPDIIEISGDNTKQVTLRGNVLVNDLVFVQGVDSSGKANIENGLVARRVVFNNENADGGTLVINAPSAVNAIVNPNNGMIVLNADCTISDPSAGDIREIKIADNIKYTINAKSGNVDLLNNGAKIIFEGAGSELNLINTGNTDKQFTLYSNLNPSDAEDEYGIIRVEATTNNLTIANNGGPYTIGQDNTHRLKEFEVKGAGNIVIDNTIFTKQFNMNNTGQVTLNQVLDLGVGGGVLFAADGKSTANKGISGSVTTATNDTGTLTIGAGNVIGTIGTNGKSLKLVNIGANPITFSSNVFAPVALTDQNSQLTLADGVVVIGSVTTKNNTRGVLSLGVGSSVTGGIGANGLSLERVEVGAGASSLGGNIYAGAVKLMADDSALTLEDNATIHGSVTTKTNEKGILIFSRNGSVTDNIGENGAALEKVIFKGVDTIEGAAYAQTFTIANANAGQSFLIAVNNANLALLTSPNSSINFSNANSQLILTVPVDQTVTFANSLKGIAGGGGIVILDGNGHNLVVRGKNGAMLGTAGNELAELNIKGDVTITNNLDIHNINKLNIQKGAYFTDQSLTSAKVAEINIGQLIDKTSYAATYALDAVNGDFELNTGGMKFLYMKIRH